MKISSNFKQAAFYILVTEGVGLLSSLLSGNISGTYSTLVKPPLSPPGWLFGVVWVILYALIGYAAYLISKERPKIRDEALTYYWVQLGLNFLWPILFFRFHLYWISAIELVILDVAVLLTLIRFKRAEPKAGWLLVPYYLWLLFATYLNIGVAILN